MCYKTQINLIYPRKEAITRATAFQAVPIHQKMTLTIKEAAEYSNIGMNKIDSLLHMPNCPFVLYVGTKRLIKRIEFEKFINQNYII